MPAVPPVSLLPFLEDVSQVQYCRYPSIRGRDVERRRRTTRARVCACKSQLQTDTVLDTCMAVTTFQNKYTVLEYDCTVVYYFVNG